jgi:DNA repair exonuclease SbcCD ATPase subunit
MLWFGALEGERLNQVRNMLNRIRSTCGALGLIGHEEVMKEAIFDRIEATTKGNAGSSTVKVSWAAGLSERNGATSLPIQV